MSGDYGSLQAAIVRELRGRTDLTVHIQAAIKSAITHYQAQMLWPTEQEATAVTVANQANIAVPDDFLFEDGFTATISGYPQPLIYRDWATLQDWYVPNPNLTGQPTNVGYYADQFWFYPTPDRAYTLTLWYTHKLTDLSADTDSNIWTTDAEELIRSRVVSDIKANILNDVAAKSEMMQFAMATEGFFSGRERIAFNALYQLSVQRQSSGTIRPISF